LYIIPGPIGTYWPELERPYIMPGPFVHNVPRRNLLGIQLPPGLSFFPLEKLVEFVCDLI
jgi:hypothetical protein